MLAKAYTLALALCYFFSPHDPVFEPARIRPRPIPSALLQAVCTEHSTELSQQEILICRSFKDPTSTALLDFASTTCGYTSACSRDPEPIPDICPVDVQPGVLSRILLNETLHDIVIGGQYQRVELTLECLRDNPDLSQHINSMNIEFDRAGSEWNFYDRLDDGNYPPPSNDFIRNTTSVFLESLQAMPNLRNMTLHIPASLPRYWKSFQEVVQQQAPLSLTIEHLSVGSHVEALFGHCPDLKSASMHEWWRDLDDRNKDETFSAFLQHLSNSTAREVRIDRWFGVDDFKFMHETIPMVNKLELTGRLDLEEHMPALRQFTQLELLGLPDVADLQLGFDPPWCGNAYMDDPTLHDRVSAAARQYEALALELVCKGIPRIKQVRFGDDALTWHNLTTPECEGWRSECKEAPDCYKNVTRDHDSRSY